MSNMPSMPLPSVKPSESVDPASLLPEDSFDSEVEEELDTKPEIITAESQNSSRVNVPSVPKKGIDVVATGKGFYNQERLKAEDKFTVKKFEDLGEWMRCVDPQLEKKRRAMLEEKRKNNREKAKRK